jgi:class 3 adenylate cyclase
LTGTTPSKHHASATATRRLQVASGTFPVVTAGQRQDRFNSPDVSLQYAYDVWGDAVNVVASRMQISGEPGRIHATEDVYLRLGHR